MKRITAFAFVIALCIIAGGVSVWRVHAAAISSLQQSQLAAARSLLDAGTSDQRVLANAIGRPGLHVSVLAFDSAVVYDNDGETISTRPRPNAGNGPPDAIAAPDDGPGGNGGPPPGGNGGPPPGANGQPPFGPPPDRPGRIAQIAGQLGGIPAMRLQRNGLTLVIAPNLRNLGAWLEWDASIVVLALIAVVVLAIRAGSAVAATERARLQAVADERKAAAVEFQRFLADAGHELRTPLTIVSGYVDILSARADAQDDTLRRLFEGMRAETARMRALVEKMLLLARLETPVAVPRLVDMGSVADEAAQAMTARYPKRAIELRNGRSAPIVIDQDDLYEAMHNLIENALKYAPESPVTVETGVRDGRAYATVTDHGPGIPASEREAIFRRFYRGNGRSDAEGSGLGLAIVSRVADRWSGTIALSSIPGDTSFTLSFPLADEERHAVVIG